MIGVADIEEDGVLEVESGKKFVDCETQTHARDFVPLLKRKSADAEMKTAASAAAGDAENGVEETVEKRKMSFAPVDESGGEEAAAKTNYKEIFKEIFTVLSKVRAETERV